eukprot:m.225422 g.225422  ORF g.225422 m.225422 type:complete len:61 (-) comp19206_c0_seq4:443-625(-)
MLHYDTVRYGKTTHNKLFINGHEDSFLHTNGKQTHVSVEDSASHTSLKVAIDRESDMIFT